MGGGGGGRLLSGVGGEGRGSGTHKLMYPKWPDQNFPSVNCVFCHPDPLPKNRPFVSHIGWSGGTMKWRVPIGTSGATHLEVLWDGGSCCGQRMLGGGMGRRQCGMGGFWVWVWVGTLAPYCTSAGRRASFECSGGLSGSMRPDVHHCCLSDRQVKRMLCSVHPPPLAVCHLLSHPLSTGWGGGAERLREHAGW